MHSATYRSNTYGQLGQGTSISIGDAPNLMGAALPFVSLGSGQIASRLTMGMFHTCALLTAGVKCWGWVSSVTPPRAPFLHGDTPQYTD